MNHYDVTIRETRRGCSGRQPFYRSGVPGKASIQTTMDRYVHVTDDTLEMAVKQFEENRVS